MQASLLVVYIYSTLPGQKPPQTRIKFLKFLEQLESRVDSPRQISREIFI